MNFSLSNFFLTDICLKKFSLLAVFSATLCLGIFLVSCQTEQNKSVTTVFSGQAMTMNYRIIIGSKLSRQEISMITHSIQSIFDEINAIYNNWNPNSELSHLNNLAKNVKYPLSQKLESFLKKTHEIVELTEGRFDPTIAPIHQLWKEKLVQGQTPTFEQINSIAKGVGWNKIHFEQGQFWKDHSLTALDLGGIAKGYCVDLLVELLNSQGFSNVYVEWGGEIRATGSHPEERPWKIFITHLGNPDPKQAIALIDLTNAAIATSGDYMQSWSIKSKDFDAITYTHIINPKTLKPLVSKPKSIASASALGPSCMLADALATAAMLFDSPEEAEQWTQTIKEKVPETQFWIISHESLPIPNK
jgi:FAD:protein FMN transferase